MTPRIDVSAAPAAIASRDSSIRSLIGGNASARASATRVRTAGSSVIRPATPTISRVVGIAANSDEKARPLASRPPAAAP
jgi:hypothetical protein